MTAGLIGPAIRPPGASLACRLSGPAAVRPLRMAGLAAALSVPDDVVYGTGRIDTSGRVADQAVSHALDWREGDRLTLTASPGVVTCGCRKPCHLGRYPTERGGFGQPSGVGWAGLGWAMGGMIFGLWA